MIEEEKIEISQEFNELLRNEEIPPKGGKIFGISKLAKLKLSKIKLEKKSDKTIKGIDRMKRNAIKELSKNIKLKAKIGQTEMELNKLKEISVPGAADLNDGIDEEINIDRIKKLFDDKWNSGEIDLANLESLLHKSN